MRIWNRGMGLRAAICWKWTLVPSQLVRMNRFQIPGLSTCTRIISVTRYVSHVLAVLDMWWSHGCVCVCVWNHACIGFTIRVMMMIKLPSPAAARARCKCNGNNVLGGAMEPFFHLLTFLSPRVPGKSSSRWTCVTGALEPSCAVNKHFVFHGSAACWKEWCHSGHPEASSTSDLYTGCFWAGHMKV